MKKATSRWTGIAVVMLAGAAVAQPGPANQGASKAHIGATHKDVSFFVVGKSTLHRQDAQGKLGPTSYYLFSEVFLNDGGTATRASMAYPGGSLQDFSNRGNAFRVQRRDFASRAQLDAAFPEGTYTFEIDAPGGHVAPFAVNFRPRRADPFPPAIRVTFKQAGKTVRQDRIDPKLDLLILWTPFKTGRADPNGILGDVSFAIMSDCQGKSVARSELPFKETPALSYADREFRVPAERFAPASAYKLRVEHAELVDVVERDGIVGLATYPTVTETVLSTLGAQPECTK